MKIKKENMGFYKMSPLNSIQWHVFIFSFLPNFSHDVPHSLFLYPFRPSPSTVLLLLLFFDLSLSVPHHKFYPHPPQPTILPPHFLTKQEVLPDRKRVTTRSYLPITPADTDSSRNFTCVASNPAVPMGKRATVTLNVHRMLLLFPIKCLGALAGLRWQAKLFVQTQSKIML